MFKMPGTSLAFLLSLIKVNVGFLDIFGYIMDISKRIYSFDNEFCYNNLYDIIIETGN